MGRTEGPEDEHRRSRSTGAVRPLSRTADAVTICGTVANVGVHGAPATLHLEDLWIKNVTITTGLVDTFSTPRLLSMLAAGRLQLPGLITHRFGLDEMQDAYDVFSSPATTGALKVALFGEQGF
jgi:alcohol dehydrogenase